MHANEVRRIREKLGLNRNEFAETFGLASYNSVSNIELGQRNPGKLLCIVLRTLDALSSPKANELMNLLRRHGK